MAPGQPRGVTHAAGGGGGDAALEVGGGEVVGGVLLCVLWCGAIFWCDGVVWCGLASCRGVLVCAALRCVVLCAVALRAVVLRPSRWGKLAWHRCRWQPGTSDAAASPGHVSKPFTHALRRCRGGELEGGGSAGDPGRCLELSVAHLGLLDHCAALEQRHCLAVANAVQVGGLGLVCLGVLGDG